jgi:hypothetical protein
MLALLGGGLVIFVVVDVTHGTDVSDKDDTDDKRGTISLLLQLYKHHYTAKRTPFLTNMV